MVGFRVLENQGFLKRKRGSSNFSKSSRAISSYWKVRNWEIWGKNRHENKEKIKILKIIIICLFIYLKCFYLDITKFI